MRRSSEKNMSSKTQLHTWAESNLERLFSFLSTRCDRALTEKIGAGDCSVEVPVESDGTGVGVSGSVLISGSNGRGKEGGVMGMASPRPGRQTFGPGCPVRLRSSSQKVSNAVATDLSGTVSVAVCKVGTVFSRFGAGEGESGGMGLEGFACCGPEA